MSVCVTERIFDSIMWISIYPTTREHLSISDIDVMNRLVAFSQLGVELQALPFSDVWLNHSDSVTPILLKVLCFFICFGFFCLARLANDHHIVKFNGHFSVLIVLDFLRPFNTLQWDRLTLILTIKINYLTLSTDTFLTL